MKIITAGTLISFSIMISGAVISIGAFLGHMRFEYPRSAIFSKIMSVSFTVAGIGLIGILAFGAAWLIRGLWLEL